LKRVETDIAKGDHAMAIKRLEGSLALDPLNSKVLDMIASIFDAYGLEDRAGRYWYLLPKQRINNIDAIKAFETSLGSDPTLILKRLITKSHFAFSKLDDQQLLILEDLLNQSREKEGRTPKFLLALQDHIDKRKGKGE
jgi:hypothetical protein